ncbi:LysR substrate-binding domain-containing protein [Methylobacterium soli]|uniref:LysR family transcriptional regulator n=1 Tax=Methylobacterium soli TaxID=553447 RepID=A0A6L3SQ41_9HYPH|nr:LysR substrate-binding domain-containing protein [Methylobacterium soli]KAB1072702.1 LysR family transcriptional regulator [Methylobacterium soli]GJE43710.1 Glycine cleavage system transcriptional activator [Methylobacterium soli]
MNERELPLTALRAFAVAARSQNLEAAAKQLGVTHGAVSKQISALEEWLGQSLFSRQGRALQLTPYGNVLADRVADSIRQIGAACDYVRRDHSYRVISVDAPATFAMYFLLPRIREFEARHAGLSVWIATRLTGQTADFSRNDVVISRGSLAKASVRIGPARHLFEEKLTPVSASSLLRELPVKCPADIWKHKPIASSSRPGDWEAWFERARLGRPLIEGGHRFDHLHVALHAVRDGLGSTIAPRQFFDGTSRRYRLRCPLPDVCYPGESFYAHSTLQPIAAPVEIFLTWLQEQCGFAER